METILYLSCNQLNHNWEVRDSKNNILYTGELWECKTFKRLMESDEI